MDHTLVPYSLVIAGGGTNTHCWIDEASERTSCIGSHVPKDRLPKLIKAVQENIVLIHPENMVKRAMIFDASVDNTFFRR